MTGEPVKQSALLFGESVRSTGKLALCKTLRIGVFISQDGVVLARTLRDAVGSSGFRDQGPGSASRVAAALREYERQRSSRVFPVTARSAAFGVLLQLPYAPVSCVVRGAGYSAPLIGSSLCLHDFLIGSLLTWRSEELPVSGSVPACCLR